MSEPRSNSDNATGKAPRRKRSEKSDPKVQPDSQSVEDSIPGRVISLTAIDRDGMISVAAYYRAERRHFEPGHELDDWLAAEAEIDAILLSLSGGMKAPV